jgi:Ca2+-binding RTX toxin-like protein
LGDADSDVLYGRAGRDVLIGGLGADQLYGSTSADLIFGGDIEEFVADDPDTFDLTELWVAWASGNSDDAMFQLKSFALDDITRDSVHGESDDDWYLMFLAHKDTFRLASESKTPNKLEIIDNT